MIKIYCDRCKHEIEEHEESYTVVIANYNENETESFHLCRVCKLFLYDFLDVKE